MTRMQRLGLLFVIVGNAFTTIGIIGGDLLGACFGIADLAIGGFFLLSMEVKG